MLELDFSPKSQRVEKKKKESIYFYILFGLFIIMSLLYFKESRRASNLMNKQEKILKTIHEQLEGKTPISKEISPQDFLFRGVIGDDKNVYILLEGEKNKVYLVENRDILLGWEINYTGGDSLILRSLKTREKILLKIKEKL